MNLDFLTYPLATIINLIYKLCNNYAVAIIIFTIIIKAVLFPMTLKSMKTTMKMQGVQAKYNVLKEKYKDNKEKLMVETQNLYKRENISPFAGFLPQLISILIMISIYYIVNQPLTHILHYPDAQIQAEFVTPLIEQGVIANNDKYPLEEQYIHSQYHNRQVDLINLAYKNGIIDTTLINFDFLGLDISKSPSEATKKTDDQSPNWWYLLFPLLTFATVFGSQKIMQYGVRRMQASQPSKKKPDDAEKNPMQKQTQTMMTYMLIIQAWITFQFSAALGLYWIVSNILQIFQQWYINETVRKPAPASN